MTDHDRLMIAEDACEQIQRKFDMVVQTAKNRLAEIHRLRELLTESHKLMRQHEVWDGECPMTSLTEFNATILEPALEEMNNGAE